MPALHELQRAVCRSLVARDDGDAAICIRAEGVAANARLSIYRHTFVATLTNALRLSYPAVHRLVGAEFFEAAAQRFIEGEPPRGAYLEEYGAGFPEFLAQFPPAASLPYLPDVARLEAAVSRALHASDAMPLDVASLATVADGDRGRICFVPHPSISPLCVRYPVDVIWRAVLAQDDAALRAIDLDDAPLWLLVQRLEAGVDVRRLREPEWRFASALHAGQPIEAAVDLVPAIDVAALLAEHLAARRFIAWRLAQPAHAPEPTDHVP